jgi:hypothetical protein
LSGDIAGGVGGCSFFVRECTFRAFTCLFIDEGFLDLDGGMDFISNDLFYATLGATYDTVNGTDKCDTRGVGEFAKGRAKALKLGLVY